MSARIGTCTMPGNWYSTGSSTVTRLSVGSRISSSDAYSVDVLPEPVGPVMRISPFGRRRSSRHAPSSSASMPDRASSNTGADGSRMRMTAFSPK
jgi:hypothetical protein